MVEYQVNMFPSMEKFLIRPTISDVAVSVRFSAQSEQSPWVLGHWLELNLCHVGAGHVPNPGMELGFCHVGSSYVPQPGIQLSFGDVGAGDVSQAVVVPVVVWPKETVKYQCCWDNNLLNFFFPKIQ